MHTLTHVGGGLMNTFDPFAEQFSQPNRGKSSSYISLNVVPGPNRSNSMFGYNDAISKVTPIEGSFICVDNSRRKLSDMGKFKINGRNVHNNRSNERPQSLLVNERARFVKF